MPVDQTARIGTDVFIDESAQVGVNVSIGDRCVIKEDVRLLTNVCIGQGAHIGPRTILSQNVVLADEDLVGGTPSCAAAIEANVRIGANAVILANLTIGEGAVIGAGSVVTRSIPRHAVVVGNPARIIRYTQSLSQSDQPALSVYESIPTGKRPAVRATPVDGVSIHYQPIVRDMRGNLSVGEFLKDIPFIPKRYFFVFDVPSKEARGEHAHFTLQEFLICVRGSCAVVVDDGTHRMEVTLDTLDKGIYLPPMIWRTHYKHSFDAVLLVFASHYYDPADYIRNYPDFILERNNGAGDADEATQ